MKLLRNAWLGWACLTLAGVANSTMAGEQIRHFTADRRHVLSESIRREARAAADRGMDWLVAHQHDDGHWSSDAFPALTALPLWALTRGGWPRDDHMEKAVRFILSCAHANGAIYREPTQKRKGGGLTNYNTAICMVALSELEDPAYYPTLLKARQFLAESQYLGPGIFRGGMGYDASTDRAYTDLSNSYLAFEAMQLTEDLEEFRSGAGPRADLDWQAAREFIQRCHNHPSFNQRPWVSRDPNDVGGFVYHPDNTRAGTYKTDHGVIKFRSFGSMTYAGLLSYIYADVDRSDPRVESAFRWAQRHWTLTENPGCGQEGRYYYLHVLAKGLSAYGEEVITPVSGEPFSWRKDLLETLLSLQHIDEESGGVYWVNEVGRYMESDKVLVTSYVLLAIDMALAASSG